MTSNSRSILDEVWQEIRNQVIKERIDDPGLTLFGKSLTEIQRLIHEDEASKVTVRVPYWVTKGSY